MASWLRADARNRRKLAECFPDVVDEIQKRLRSPGGVLPSEHDWLEFEAPRRR